MSTLEGCSTNSSALNTSNTLFMSQVLGSLHIPVVDIQSDLGRLSGTFQAKRRQA
jgi:hypothetical protein